MIVARSGEFFLPVTATRTIVQAEKYEPSVVARFAVDVAQAFNKFYNSTRINVPEENVKNARVMLTYLTKKTLHDALDLLGINAPEAM